MPYKQQKHKCKNSHTGTRTRVSWVRAMYPNHLDYMGIYHPTSWSQPVFHPHPKNWGERWQLNCQWLGYLSVLWVSCGALGTSENFSVVGSTTWNICLHSSLFLSRRKSWWKEMDDLVADRQWSRFTSSMLWQSCAWWYRVLFVSFTISFQFAHQTSGLLLSDGPLDSGHNKPVRHLHHCASIFLKRTFLRTIHLQFIPNLDCSTLSQFFNT